MAILEADISFTFIRVLNNVLRFNKTVDCGFKKNCSGFKKLLLVVGLKKYSSSTDHNQDFEFM